MNVSFNKQLRKADDRLSQSIHSSSLARVRARLSRPRQVDRSVKWRRYAVVLAAFVVVSLSLTLYRLIATEHEPGAGFEVTPIATGSVSSSEAGQLRVDAGLYSFKLPGKRLIMNNNGYLALEKHRDGVKVLSGGLRAQATELAHIYVEGGVFELSRGQVDIDASAKTAVLLSGEAYYVRISGVREAMTIGEVLHWDELEVNRERDAKQYGNRNTSTEPAAANNTSADNAGNGLEDVVPKSITRTTKDDRATSGRSRQFTPGRDRGKMMSSQSSAEPQVDAAGTGAKSRGSTSERVYNQLAKLRSRGEYAKAIRLLRDALKSSHSNSERQRFSYELGSIMTYQLKDDRACKHWAWHVGQFIDGRYEPEIERARRRLGCDY